MEPIGNQNGFWAVKNEYMRELEKKLEALSGQFKKEFDLLRKDPEKKVFVINGEKISLSEFALLFGNDCFYSKGFGSRWEFYPEVSQKKIFREVEEYLGNVPGVIMPEVPAIIQEWLEKD